MRATNSASFRYQARTPPVDLAQLPTFIDNELYRLGISLNAALDGNYELQTVAPDKPRAGMVRYADGVNWTPGSSAGLYFYTTAWRYVFTVGSSEQAFLLTSGGTVTQGTSKSTGVTLNTQSGQITLNGAALAADTNVSFVMTNSTISATDLLVLNHVSGGTINAYKFNPVCAAGSATIHVRNVTAGPLSEAIVIRFTRVPGATS